MALGDTKNGGRSQPLNTDFLPRAIMDITRDGFAITDVDGVMIECNAATELLLGWASQDLLGKKVAETILPPEHHAFFREKIERCIKGMSDQGLETIIQRQDGNSTRVLIQFNRVDDAGTPFLLMSIQDRNAAWSAKRSEEPRDRLLQAVLDNAPFAISIFAPDGRVLAVNRFACDFLGASEEEMVGRTMDPPTFEWTGYDHYVAEMVPKMLSERCAVTAPTQMRHANGKMRDMSVTIFPIYGSDGELQAQCMMAIDHTDQVEAQREAEIIRSQLQGFFDNVPGEMYLKNLDRTFVYCSPGLAVVSGVSQVDLVGKSEDDTIDPRFRDRAALLHNQIVATKKPTQGEFFQPRTQKYKQVTQFPIINDAGEVTHVGGMILDIDDRVRAQRELQDAQAQLKSFVDNAPVAMSISAAPGKLLMVNKTAAAYYGRTPEELMAGDPLVVAAAWPERESKVVPAYLEVIETKTTRVLETTIKVVGREEPANVILSAFPILDTEDNVSAIGAVVVDVTDIHEAQRDVARSQEALHQSEKLAALGQLLAGVAHELNNPLAIVLGRASILQEKLQDSEHLASLSKLRDAADRCARIVKTFLAMARQSGPRREMVQINDLIAGALDMTAYGLRQANVTLVQDLDPTLPETEADEDQIVQLLINLIVNAQHALQTVDQNRHLTVATRHAASQNAIFISVADNGPGVSPSEAARIFEPFYTTKDVGEGTGLGLSVCRGLIEAHGGTLTLRPTPGGGATFEAMLPTLKSSMIRQFSEEAEPEASKAKGQILIVDDEPEIGALLADCLTPLGVKCHIATDAKAALQLAAETQFDAIFCDVRMPDMDGIALLAALKQEHPELASRLAFVSGDVLHRDVVQIKAASDRPIIEKPFHPQQVRDVAMELIAQAGEQA